jgi:hypothetical protein
MRKSSFTLIPLLLIAALVTPAYANRVIHSAAKISIEIPNTWDAEYKNDTIVIQDKNDEVEILFMAVDDAVIKEAVKAVTKNLEKKVKGLKLGKPTTKTINGMTAIIFEGDGMVGDINVDIAIVVVDAPPKDKDLLVIAVAEDAKLAKHKKNILAVFNSLQPAK